VQERLSREEDATDAAAQESETGAANVSRPQPQSSPHRDLLSVRRELHAALGRVHRERERLQTQHARHVQMANMQMHLQVPSELNDVSTLLLAPLNACGVCELALALLRSLESVGAPSVRPGLHAMQSLRLLLRDAYSVLLTALPLATQRQADELGLGRRLLSLGECGPLYELMQRGVRVDLSVDTGAEWTALQRLCEVDEPLDHRCILLLLRFGLDASDATLSHPERPAAIRRARQVKDSAAAVGVRPSSLEDIGRAAPRSMLRAELESPIRSAPATPSQTAGRAVGGHAHDDSHTHSASRTPSHVRFCVDLVEQWRLHSHQVRGALADALLQLGHDDRELQTSRAEAAAAAAASTSSASSSSISSSAAATATVAAQVVVLHLVGEYLDLES